MILLLMYLIMPFFFPSCGAKSVKFESQNVELQTSKKKISLNIRNIVNTDLEYFIYFANSLNQRILISTELVPVKDEKPDLIADVSIDSFNETIIPNTNFVSIRIDLVTTISLTTLDSNFVISNYSLTQTLITNVIYQDIYNTSVKDELFDKLRYVVFNELAVNTASVITKGWRENYGAYTTTNTLIKSIIGGHDATNTTKAKKRNLPTIGGE